MWFKDANESDQTSSLGYEMRLTSVTQRLNNELTGSAILNAQSLR